MARKEKRVCPRERFVKKNFSSGATKFGQLRRILKHVVIKVTPKVTSAQMLEQLLKDEFDSLAGNVMLPFEAEREQRRMLFLLTRWLNYENQMWNSTVVARGFSSEFQFAGQTESRSIHWLVDRGDCLEAICFKYKAPEYSYQARTPQGRPNKSSELLMLQRAGEVKAAELGFDVTKKPVFGAIYYMKHRSDTSKDYSHDFEDKPGTNVILHHFYSGEAADVEQEYTEPDCTKTCDPKECDDCLYNDLCHLEFEKRHLMEQPPLPVRTIDDINLTDAQVSFVSFLEGECRVNAVAGSGKTTVVALRTLNLIESGTDPSKILMVTFTEKAKGEMAARVKGFAKGKMCAYSDLKNIDNVHIETFNSWGQHLLDEYFSMLGFTAQPTLIDDVTKKDIVIQLLDAHRNLPLDYCNPFLSTPAAQGAVTKMVKWIDAMKAAHVETEAEVLETLGAYLAPNAAELLAIYNEYNGRLMAINAIDYEDQLRLLLKLADFGIFEKLDYEHIVIDEFQDSNPNQIDIILELKRRNPRIKSLVVVGDELQAIYGFRNATPDNLVDFAKYFPNMVDIDMTANFRSQQPIIQLANQIIAKTARLGKIIDAHRQNSNVQPKVINIEDQDEEVDLYCRQIQKLITKTGVKPNSIAVLCRTRKELIKIQMALEKYNIPSILKVPEIVADAPYVKAIIAFANFLNDTDDMAALGLYGKSLGQDPFDEKALNESAVAVLDAFDRCKTEEDKILTFLGFIQDATEDYVGAAFVDKMKSFNFHTLRQYLDYCVKYKTYGINDTQSTAKEDTDCVTLITVHSAKGLEWDTVLLSLRRFPVDEESSRLFYVGVTRARDRLLVTFTSKQQVLANLLAS